MSALPLTSDCVALWRFDEALATDSAVDAGPNGYDLTDYGSPAVVTPGVVGASMRRLFDGDAFRRTAVANLRTLTSVTIACIVKPSSAYSKAGTYRTLMYLPRTNSTYYAPAYGICSASQDKFDFQASFALTGYPGGQVSVPVAPTVLTPDVGHLLVAIYDKDAKLASWFVDGALISAVSTAPYDTLNYGAGTDPMIVGGNWYFIGAGIQYYAGCDIDEAAIYGTAKDASWVSVVYSGYASTAFSLSALSLEYADLGIARKAVEQAAGATLTASDTALSLSALSLEYSQLGIARKAVEQAAGNTLAAPNSLFSLSGVSVEYMPLNRLRPMGSARSA